MGGTHDGRVERARYEVFVDSRVWFEVCFMSTNEWNVVTTDKMRCEILSFE